MATRPNERVERLGVMLLHQVAGDVAAAQLHLLREQRACSWPSRGESAGGSSTPATTTETAALASIDFGHAREDLEDAIYGAEIAVKHLARTARDALGKTAPPSAGVKRCADAQFGKDAEAWSDDLSCRALADKAGLCTRHYSAWRRHRVAAGRDTSGDYEPGIA